MKYLIMFVLGFMYSGFCIGQGHLLIPKRGIAGVPIIIDSSNINEVINFYGNSYQKKEYHYTTIYRYDSLGLIFELDPYDKNEIIRSIEITYPMIAKTNEGVILNQSSMEDVHDIYQQTGCFTSKHYAYFMQEGISFYIRKKANKRRYNTKEKIYKIEIHNRNKNGNRSRVNFEFNSEPYEQKIQLLFSILQSEDFKLDYLNDFKKNEDQNKIKPYYFEVNNKFNRVLENGFTQNCLEIRTIKGHFDINIIFNHEKLAYLKFSTAYDNILIERKMKEELDKLYNVSKIDSSILSISDFLPFNNYVFGSFCGAGGSPPMLCNQMLEMVREGNYHQLAYWLKSKNPEISAYGYFGLAFLKLKGQPIQEAEKTRMQYLKQLDIELNICEGCFFGIHKPMKILLADKEVLAYFNMFKEFGWLK